MSKAAISASTFLKRNESSGSDFKEGFQTPGLVKRQSIGLPLTVKLSNAEEVILQKLLHEYYNPSVLEESEVESHFTELKTITEEIKCISVQSVLMHGERIQKAEKMLKDYRDGAFTRWLVAAYGNRQTPYSMLRYFELYEELESENLKKKLESMPKKAAYTLAFRQGPSEKKRAIVEGYSGQKQKEVILEIQNSFPSANDDGRKPKSPNSDILGKMFDQFKKLEKNREDLTEKNKQFIRELINSLQELIE